MPSNETKNATIIEDMRYVGVWYRFLANFLDGIFVSILGIPFLAPMFVIGFVEGFKQAQSGETATSAELVLSANQQVLIMLLSIGYVTFVCLYHIWLTSSKLQGTFAKRILGIKVVDLNGERISFKRSAARFFVGQSLSLPNSLLSNSQLTALKIVGYTFAFFHFIFHIVSACIAGADEKKRTIHDRVAKTYVIYRD